MPTESEAVKKSGTRIILNDMLIELAQANIITLDQFKQAANEINNIYP